MTYRGAVIGWGSNKYGQLGDDPKKIPDVKAPRIIQLQKSKGAQLICAGKYHSCAITKEDVLYFWGSVSNMYL